MTNSITDQIEAWFRTCDGDGEFAVGTRAMPLTVVPPLPDSDSVLFTTKPALLSAAFANGEGAGAFGLIGRYGLPTRLDLEWISTLAGSRTLGFLGDLDPVDLLIFAWLRESVRPRPVVHLGINDALLDALQIPATDLTSIPCSASEQKAFPWLTAVFPDFGHQVGARSSHILRQGQKIELEAVIGASTAPILSVLGKGELS